MVLCRKVVVGIESGNDERTGSWEEILRNRLMFTFMGACLSSQKRIDTQNEWTTGGNGRI